jgi:hypothetical protein
MSIRRAIARAFRFALLATFVWVGGAALTAAVKHDPLKLPLDPEVSSDGFLTYIGGPHPTKTVNEMLRPWGEDQVLLVVAPATNPSSTKIYYELVILGYPRRMPAIMCKPHPAGGAEYHRELESRNIDGLIFFGMVPGRGVAGARQVAPKLYVAPYEGVAAWNSFCP